MGAIINVAEALSRDVSRREVQTTVAMRNSYVTKGNDYQEKDVAYPTSTQYSHGPSSLLNQPGVDPNVISTVYRTRGISRNIPFVPSRNMVPLFKMLTSQATSTGSEPADACARGPIPGKLTEMQLTAPFGLLKRSTETVSMDRIGQIVNRGEPMDLRLINDPSTASPWVPQAASNMQINSELRMQYWRLGLDVERKMEIDAFTSSGSGQGTTNGYRGFYGLDSLINTGKTDLVTGGLVPAADALVVAWNSQLMTATQSIYGANTDLVTLISRMLKYLEGKAVSTGMLPIQWRLAMRHDLFWELTSVWPCSYLTNQCTSTNLNGATQYISGAEQVAMRDSMRNGRFLWVNGVQMPVDLVDTNSEVAAASGAKSDIYFIPYSAGGLTTLYYEFFDFSNPELAAVVGEMMPKGEFTVTDGGKYIWTFNRTSYCTYFELMVQARLVLRTAFLAARITNVVYPSVLHTFDANPSGIYFQQGGGSTVGSYNPAALYSTTSI